MPVDSARHEQVRTVIPPQDGRLLQNLSLFRHGVLVLGRLDGGSRLWLLDPETGALRDAEFDEAVYEVSEGDNPDYNAASAVIWYESMVTPLAAHVLDVVTGQRTLFEQKEILGCHEPAAYVSERTFVTAVDGTQVPVSLVRRRDVAAGPRP